MFKKSTTQLFFYGLLLCISVFIYSAADDFEEVDVFEGYSTLKPEFQYLSSSSRSSQGLDAFDPMGLRAKAAAKRKELLKPKRIIPDEDFDQLLWHHKTDLPSKEDAEHIVHRLMQDLPDLKFTIPCIKDPNHCEGEYPSRLLFVGPSGCGKTTAAKAVAKYCDANCIFLKGSKIGNTYQNSGAMLINDLFNGLLERSDQSFIVIIDEFISISQFTDDDKDRQQRQTAMALWQALDDCEKKQHICVIGTDNGDPKKLPFPVKTRFAYNIFEFHHMNQRDIVTFMKKRLGYSLENEDDNPCSDKTLNQLAQSVNSLSWREIDTLLSKSRMLAADESNEPKPIVKEGHLKKIFNDHREPTWLEKLWIDRDKHIDNLTSARAVSLYMMTGGFGLQLLKHRYPGLGFIMLGGFINQAWADGKDLQLFSLASNLCNQYENYMQWKTSHDLSVQNIEETRSLRSNDDERIKEQDKKADKHREWEIGIAETHLALALKADSRNDREQFFAAKDSLQSAHDRFTSHEEKMAISKRFNEAFPEITKGNAHQVIAHYTKRYQPAQTHKRSGSLP